MVIAAVVIAAIVAIDGRGPWYDEFYTFSVTDPARTFSLAWRDYWLPDNHPPLYYALVWSTGGLAGELGDGVEPRRYLNLALLAVALVAGFAMTRRRAQVSAWLVPFVIALASVQPVIERVSELRSNFLALAAAAVLVAALITFARPQSGRMTRGEGVVTGLAMLIAFNVHFTATVICGVLAGTFWLWNVVLRDWHRVIMLAITGALASAPFIVILALQFGEIEANTRDFWIPAGFTAARWAIQSEIEAVLLANVPLTLAAMAGFALLGWRAWQERRLGPEAQLMAVLAIAGGLAVIILLALHLWRPIVLGRYLVTLDVILAAGLALGTAGVMPRLPRLARAVVVILAATAALWAIAQNARQVIAMPSWSGTAREIARETAKCEGTLVHTPLIWNAYTLNLPPAHNRVVMPLAYRHMAARHGFDLEAQASRNMASTCPTLFWSEHVAGQHFIGADVIAQLRGAGYPIGKGELRQIGDGWVLVAYP